MATSTQESPEEYAFRKHSATLIHAITAPDVFAWQLFANDIISSSVKSKAGVYVLSKEEKNNILLTAVEGTLRANTSVFVKFTELLLVHDDLTLRIIGEKMRESKRDKESEKHPPSVTKPFKEDPTTKEESRQPTISDAAAGTPSVLETFKDHLVEYYAHPSQDRWPFLGTSAYIDLPLFEVPLTKQRPWNQQTLQPRKPVKLSKIFSTGDQKAKRKVVFLEGVAGSGKTTLTWHACQMWAEGELFQNYPLFIQISLEDPAIRSATCLADIIPHPSCEMREAVAKAIADQDGKGVCFLLDGWDEATPTVQQRGSFMYSFIAGSSGRTLLPQCSIIVTSRPAAAGPLYRYMTSKVEIGRLDRDRIDDLIALCLSPEDSEKLTQLLEHRSKKLTQLLEHRTSLAGLCNLPINASIVIFLFSLGVDLPETRTGLFKAFVCNLLIRHMHLRTSHGLRKVQEFEDLPSDVFEQFAAISLTAFRGIMQPSGVFDTPSLSDTLSLMEVHQKLTSYGPSTSYGFLHYSVQEFLAAWHMSRLGREEQAKAVSDILHSSPLSPVLPFFAGLTKLSNPAVRGILLEVTKYPLDDFNVLANQPQVESDDRRRLVLALLNCIYESQSSTLCHQIQPPRQSFATNISLAYLTLEPYECLSIGYFMANHGFSSVGLTGCSIGDAGVEALMTQLKQSAKVLTVSHSMRRLNLGNNQTTPRSMRSISVVLQQQTPLLSCIIFSGDSWQPAQVPTYMTYLIEGLCRSSNCMEIALPVTVNSKHAHYLVLLITACRLKYFCLGWTSIREGFLLIAEAIRRNVFLQEIALPRCNLGNRELIALGLNARISLTKLLIPENPFTSCALREFLQYHFFSRLNTLEIGRPLNHEEMLVYSQLLHCRRQTGLVPLTLSGFSNWAIREAVKSVAFQRSLPKGVQERMKNK